MADISEFEERFAPQPFPEPAPPAVVADALGLSWRATENLLAADVAAALGDGDATTFVNRRDSLVVSQEGLDRLRVAPSIPADHEPLVCARVRSVRAVDDSDRSYMGWHARLTPEEVELAVTRWWPVPKDDPVGRVFVASVSGFIVHCGRIEDVHEDRGQVAYALDTSDARITRDFWGRRIASPRGGAIRYFAAGEGALGADDRHGGEES
ncbi:MAG: hypothetical protein QM621_11835 [Aeromicrobium sp.]|uniref:hypothetical protein n=1 Tax=Aeromicrobium sp. TaxID=1871063 RepID=UPI0039E547CD